MSEQPEEIDFMTAWKRVFPNVPFSPTVIADHWSFKLDARTTDINTPKERPDTHESALLTVFYDNEPVLTFPLTFDQLVLLKYQTDYALERRTQDMTIAQNMRVENSRLNYVASLPKVEGGNG